MGVNNGNEVLYKLGKGGLRPKQGRDNDYAFDLYASEGVLVPPLTFASVKVPTGLQTAFDPSDMGMKLSLRSGVALRTPLVITNSPGIIEGDYRGEIGILVRNTFIDNRLVDFAFNIKGERINVKDIPKKVLQKALNFYKEEMELLGYADVTPEVKKVLYKTVVPAGTVYIAKHDRPAQIYFQQKEDVYMTRATHLPKSYRGEGGFGSSGINNE